MVIAASIGIGATAVGTLATSSSAALPHALDGDSPAQIVAAAGRTFVASQSVRIVGVVTNGSNKEAINISTLRNGDLSGSLVIDGALVQIIIVNKLTYLRASAAFWQRFGHVSAGVAAKIAPKWLIDSSAKSIGTDFSLATLGKSFVTDNGTLTNAGTGVVGGVKVVKVTSSKGGTLYVQEDGPSRVLEIAGKDAGGDSTTLRFTGYNAQPVPMPPPNPVPLSSIS